MATPAAPRERRGGGLSGSSAGVGGRDGTGKVDVPAIRYTPNIPILQLNARVGGFWVRALNVTLASAAFLVLSPAITCIALAIKLTSPGPAFYTQTRVGRDRRKRGPSRRLPENRVQDMGGRPFQMYKFRTMRVDAEKGTGAVWAKPGDSRVTWIGRYLRRFRIDELPQLWNVVRGDMNLVGPRPERPALVGYLANEIEGYPLRHKVQPGITGWAQVNQSYDTTLDSVRTKLMYDLDYIERRSVLFDLRIILKTIPAILKRSGW